MISKLIKTVKENLSVQILIGLLLGGIAGLFFGEMMAWLDPIGVAFIRLLQMPVIPYVMSSIIYSLGQLNYQQAKSIFFKGGIILLVSWAIILVVIVLFPLGFPAWKSASFFSTTLLKEVQPINLIELFIPANPFNALSETIVPAVVVFSLTVGFALIGMENKQGLLDVLSSAADALMRITGFVAKLTPIGVFAIVGGAVGTLPFDSFNRLAVYVVLHALLCLLLSFLVLPALVAAVTPLSFKDVVLAYRIPLITAFAIGNLLIVLPQIIETSKELLQRLDTSLDANSPKITAPLNVLVPLSFVFPSMGKLFSLTFVPFAAWFNGSSMTLSQYPAFLVTGVASLFGEGTIATQLLLNLLGIPLDMLQLYIVLNQLSASRFGNLLAGMNTVILGLLAVCAINGWMRLRRWRLLRFSAVMTLLVLLTLGIVHLFFTYAVPQTYAKDKVLAELKLLRISNPASVEVFRNPPLPAPLDPSQPSRLNAIQERGFLRACYVPDDYPTSYFNKYGDLVGLSVEMTHLLTNDLGVRTEFVPLSVRTSTDFDKVIAERLNSGYCDIYTAPISITPERTQLYTFLTPLRNATASLLVRDNRRQKFGRWAEIRELEPLRIGYLVTSLYYLNKLKGLLPEAELVPIESIEQQLDTGMLDVDAIVLAAELGTSWTLLYPDFSIVIPRPLLGVPISYAIPVGERPLEDWVNAWLLLKLQDGTVQSLFDYWIEGKIGAVKPPRWSIIRDVLHWVD